jgi:AraC family transcriptional activator of pobA
VSSTRELSYYKEFMKNIKADVPTNKSIEEYTKELGISKTHLNRVCQSIAGESTKQVIGRFLTNEAMILLAHTDLTISEIAHQLEFKDVSYFCRFFKKQALLSPAKYRDGNLNIEHNKNTVALHY